MRNEKRDRARENDGARASETKCKTEVDAANERRGRWGGGARTGKEAIKETERERVLCRRLMPCVRARVSWSLYAESSSSLSRLVPQKSVRLWAAFVGHRPRNFSAKESRKLSFRRRRRTVTSYLR